jgi:hypothetical protein
VVAFFGGQGDSGAEGGSIDAGQVQGAGDPAELGVEDAEQHVRRTDPATA